MKGEWIGYYYISDDGGGLVGSQDIHLTLIDLPSVTFVHLFQHLLDKVIFVAETC
jgi:hypothetical protein